MENLQSQNTFTELASTTLFYRLIACNSKMFLTLLAAISAKIEKISKYNYTRHAAGIVTDEVTDENFVAVTGGISYVYVNPISRYLDTTEILQDGNWTQGNINDVTICYLFGKLMVSRHFYRIS